MQNIAPYIFRLYYSDTPTRNAGQYIERRCWGIGVDVEVKTENLVMLSGKELSYSNTADILNVECESFKVADDLNLYLETCDVCTLSKHLWFETRNYEPTFTTYSTPQKVVLQSLKQGFDLPYRTLTICLKKES